MQLRGLAERLELLGRHPKLPAHGFHEVADPREMSAEIRIALVQDAEQHIHALASGGRPVPAWAVIASQYVVLAVVSVCVVWLVTR